jgi:hypothetical protein
VVDWLGKFDWRKWWHPAIALGITLAALALAIKNRDIATFGVGIAVCGCGESTLGLYFRFNRHIGFALIGLGVILMLLGLYQLIR